MESLEGMEIDEGELPSYVRRRKATTNLIPGPAGNVQAVILNRECSQPQNTQHFICRIADAAYQRDFGTNAWRWAQQFIDLHGLLGVHNLDDVSTLATIKSCTRLPLLPCVVKAVKPNGLGDMAITVKDPTGVAQASVHRKVLQDPEFGPDIHVGCVLVLKNVVVFTPNRRAYYLNITLANIVKVFRFDVTQPSDEEVLRTTPVVRERGGWIGPGSQDTLN